MVRKTQFSNGKKTNADGNGQWFDWDFWSIIVGVFAVKLMLIPCYHSTDFEVHRNWLAVTSQLPLDRWYFENTSEWTLDYPPFFAYFERGLASAAGFVDTSMLTVQNRSYFNLRTLYFQRVSVIGTDLIYVLCVFLSVKRLLVDCSRPIAQQRLLTFLLSSNAALILLDNIHFQYNSLLTALFILSISYASTGHYLKGALFYCCLLNFKHIYLYYAPAFVIFYARRFLFPLDRRFLLRAVALFGVILLPFLLSFGPFLAVGGVDQLVQIMTRLFPFKRGLTHAYWAPNIWALYNTMDMVLYHVMRMMRLLPIGTLSPGYTSGLVQDYDHSILPTVKPSHTAIVTLISLLPFAVIAFRRKSGIIHLTVLCAFNAFLFGWHVHEKAVILIMIPYTILAFQDVLYVPSCIVLSITTHFALFPLFFTPFEHLLKYLIVSTYSLIMVISIRYRYRMTNCNLSIGELCYLGGLCLLECYKIAHGFIFVDRLPFVPLLLTSIYCSIGIFYSWMCFCWLAFLKEPLQFVIKYQWRWIQERLRSQLIVNNSEQWQENVAERLKVIGGLDISGSMNEKDMAVACLTLLSYPDLKVLHQETIVVVQTEPYIAGYLAFREVDPMVRLVQKVSKERPELRPQVLFVDGNGLLHPRRFGLACHLGIAVQLPCIGVAKNLHFVDDVCSTSEQTLSKKLLNIGDTVELTDGQGQVLGAAVRTSSAQNAVFVSVGHRCSLELAVQLTLECSRYRIPEPIRQADHMARMAVVQLWQK